MAPAILLLSVTVFASATWAQDECGATERATAEQAYSTAYQFVTNGQWEEAVPSLEEALKQCPSHWSSLELLAQAKMRQKRYADAEQKYSQLIDGQFLGSLAAADQRVLHPYGVVLLRLEKWDKAELVFETILVQDPNNYDAHDRLVYRFSATGAFDKAVEHLEQMYTIAQGDKQVEVAKRLGDAHKKAGNPEAAAEWYGKTGGATSGLFDIGVTHMRKKEWAQAADAFVQYLEGRPESIAALKNLGQSLQALKRNDEAIARYEQALSLDADRHDITSTLGLLYGETRQWGKAGTIAEEAIRTWPKDDDKMGSMYYLMGRVLEKRDKNYEAAIDMFKLATNDPYWGQHAKNEIDRQRQLIEIRNMQQKQGG